jgi:hypothetical protein
VLVVVLAVIDAALDLDLDLELAVLTEVGETPGVGPDPQATVDAEFAAIVLAEAPWGASEAVPVVTPPHATTLTRLAPRPRRPREHRDGVVRRHPGAVGPRAAGRRPASVARSPPPSR